MRQYPKIWLLRHGQTGWNAQARVQGQLESSLTDVGVLQAQAQAALMVEPLLQQPACYASPLGRAQQTAQIALGDAPITTDTRLAELHAGDWQGLTHDQIRAGWPDLWQGNPRFLDLYAAAPGGEGMAALCARVESFLADLTTPSVIVAHGSLGQVMRGLVCGLERHIYAALPNDQGCVYVLENGREQVLR